MKVQTGSRLNVPKTPSDQFPNIIGYAPTKQIMAMYGNPHTPLLPQFPSSIWTSNQTGSAGLTRCMGCSNVILDRPPGSPKKPIESKGSYGNLSCPDRSNKFGTKQLNSIVKSNTNNASIKQQINFGNHIAIPEGYPSSPSMIMSPGNFLLILSFFSNNDL